VRWALQYNPEIAAIRQQHGAAAAGIVIARTYPFNPMSESRLRAANGPPDATVTNHTPFETTLLLEMEVRGQRRLRQEGALATLSRTDSEIAVQELGLAVRAARAYDTFLYRLEKLALADEAVRITKVTVEQVEKLVKAGGGPAMLKTVDYHLIRSELNDLITQAAAARAAAVTAQADLRRALGVIDCFQIGDRLEMPLLVREEKDLADEALEWRPDRRAHQAAVQEAESRLRLEVANRFGNPALGPTFEYNESSAHFIGAVLIVPIPVLNRHTGDIRQREAERDRAMLELRDTEVKILQDVNAAVKRLEVAGKWAEMYRKTIVPELKTSVEVVEELFKTGQQGVDVLRLNDVRRKLLHARDGYLDALFELRTAQADLAAALGDPALLAPGLGVGCGPK
jgi:outer membrane protein TolC